MSVKIHTTNYVNTFIAVAEDSSAVQGSVPASKGDKKTIAEMQFEMIAKKPYQYTSDDVLFGIYAERNDILQTDQETARQAFFSKGQACLRASPLTKKYGFGIHANQQGKIALYGIESEAYEKLINDPEIKVVRAMRSVKK